MIRQWEPRLVPALALGLLLVWAPLPFGSVTPWAELVLRLGSAACLAAALLVASSGRSLAPVALPAGCLAGVGVLGWLQSVELPVSVVAAIAPLRAELAAEARSLAATAVDVGNGDWSAALSLAPSYTRSVALTWLAVTACFAAAAVAGARRRPRRILWGAVLLAAFVQVFYGARLWIARSDEIWGVDVPGTAARLRGSFVNPNHAAFFLALSLAVSFALIWWALRKARTEESLDRKVTLVGPPVLIFLAIFGGLTLTASRAGLVAAIAAVGVQGLLLAAVEKRWRMAPSGVIAVVVGLGWALTLALQQVLSRWWDLWEDEVLLGSRLSAATASLDLVRSFPLFGTGLGTFREAFPLVQPQELSGDWWHLHNDLLELVVTAGLVGAALVGVAVVAVTRRLSRLLRTETRTEDRAAAMAALGALTAAAVHSWFDFSLTLPANAVLLAVIVGAALGAGARGRA